MATREGWRYQHVQAIIVAIDQYAEAATGNRDFFLNKPPGTRHGDVSRSYTNTLYSGASRSACTFSRLS